MLELGALKKILGILVLVLITTAAFAVIKSRSSRLDKTLGVVSETKSTPQVTLANSVNVEYQGKELTVSWLEASDALKILLIPNFSEKKTGEEIRKEYGCKSLVSGGFYTKDNRPSGLFIHEGDILRNWQKNSLFNGVYSINSFDIPRITPGVPQDSLRIALQSGPILKENASYKKLSLKNDEPAKRVVVATTGSNTSVFLVIYNPESVYLGPHLSDLPSVLASFEEKAGIELADALNLDGGTASTFYSERITLPELSTVGSFFCLH